MILPRTTRTAVVVAVVLVATSTAADTVVDLTSETAVEFGELTFSPETRRVTIGVRIRNGTERALVRPLRLQIADVRSKLGEVAPNATTVHFDDVVPHSGLLHGQATSDKTIVFEIAGRGNRPIDRNAGEILTMTFMVLGRLRR